MDIKEKLKRISKVFTTKEDDIKSTIDKTIKSKYDEEVQEMVKKAILDESQRLMHFERKKAVDKLLKQKRKRDISKANRKKAIKSRRK
jgi:hypothetical protein